MVDPFTVLGLRAPCTEAEVKKAYRTLAKRIHPDKTGPEGKEPMQQINAAYERIVEGRLWEYRTWRPAPNPRPAPPPQPKPQTEKPNPKEAPRHQPVPKPKPAPRSEPCDYDRRNSRPYTEASRGTYYHPKYGSYTPSDSQTYSASSGPDPAHQNGRQQTNDTSNDGFSFGPSPSGPAHEHDQQQTRFTPSGGCHNRGRDPFSRPGQNNWHETNDTAKDSTASPYSASGAFSSSHSGSRPFGGAAGFWFGLRPSAQQQPAASSFQSVNNGQSQFNCESNGGPFQWPWPGTEAAASFRKRPACKQMWEHFEHFPGFRQAWNWSSPTGISAAAEREHENFRRAMQQFEVYVSTDEPNKGQCWPVPSLSFFTDNIVERWLNQTDILEWDLFLAWRNGAEMWRLWRRVGELHYSLKCLKTAHGASIGTPLLERMRLYTFEDMFRGTGVDAMLDHNAAEATREGFGAAKEERGDRWFIGE